MINNIPLGRLATESDIATAIVYLASNASSMITGSSLMIDGGMDNKIMNSEELKKYFVDYQHALQNCNKKTINDVL